MFGGMNRRHFLKHVAGASALAVPGMQFMRGLRAAEPTLKKEHKSLVIFWMGGGPSHMDTWDLKPGESTGGEFKPMDTSAPGVQISEILPTVAEQMKHLSIVRSLVTNEGSHERGTVLMNTGRQPSPVVSYPALGAVAKKALARKTGARGLRSILEQVLLDTMYELPALENVSKVVVDEQMISADGKPLLIYSDPPKVAGSSA